MRKYEFLRVVEPTDEKLAELGLEGWYIGGIYEFISGRTFPKLVYVMQRPIVEE